jgi:TolA-binding protein
MTFLPSGRGLLPAATGGPLSRPRSVPFSLPSLLLLGLWLSRGAHADSTHDTSEEELRSQRATRRVLDGQGEEEDPDREARAILAARRQESIRMLKGVTPDAVGERRAEMLLRLASLYQDEADYQRDLAWDDCLERTQGACPDGPDLTHATHWQSMALRLYEQVTNHYPEYARVDEAAWGRATILMDTGRIGEAQKVLILLVRTWPDSPRAPGAYVLIGDHHFTHDRALPALSAYRHAAAWPDAEIRPYALYKQAWCLYNLGEYHQAIATMRAVATTPSEGTRIPLHEEARRDLARFFADAGDLHGALEFYRSLNRPDLLREALGSLSAHLVEQGEPDRAVEVLTLLITALPHDPQAPGWQASVVRIRQGQGRGDQALEALERLLRSYGPHSPWSRANAADPDAAAEALSVTESTLRQVAVDWHQQARKLGRGRQAKDSAGRALAAYRAWLDRFAERPEAHELRYAYAELLYEVDQHEQAWEQYREVLRRHPQGSRSEFCAQSAVHVAAERVGGGTEAAQTAPGTDPQALSTWEERLLTSVDAYLAQYPEGERSLAFATKAAWLLYHRNHFAQAADRFTRVIAMDPGSEEAEIAADLILDSLALVGETAKLVQTSEAFLAMEELGRPGFRATLEDIHQRARFALIDDLLAQDGDRASAALAFETFAQRYPDSPVAPLALHNAAVHHRAAGEPHGAIRAATALVDRYPDSEHRAAALAGLGFDHESLADFDEAAAWYERLAQEQPEHEDAADALWSAALFRLARGQDPQAERDLRQHARRWPDHPRQGELLALLADLDEQAERHAQAAATWARVEKLAEHQASPGLRAQALVRQGRALRAAGQADLAQQAWAEAVERWGAPARAPEADPGLRESVAEALYQLGSERLAHYEAIDLGGHAAPSGRSAAQAWARRQVSAKAQALVELEQASAAVLETGAGSWGLTALVRLGGAYEHMAHSLRGAWVPPWLTPEQAELYRLELDDEAWHLEEKAAAAYRAAVQRSRELAVYGEALDAAAARLGALRPEESPTPKEALLPPAYLGTRDRLPAFAGDQGW